jgi:hypothetical protein
MRTIVGGIVIVIVIVAVVAVVGDDVEELR